MPTPLPLDLDSVRCFEEAATQLSFRVAAARVALSAGAFSERIRRLEEELGAPLFERTTRRVRLTAAGQRLLPEARALLRQAERCRAVTRGDGPREVELTLGTRFELGMSWLTPAVGELEAAVPGLTLHLDFGASRDLLDRVVRAGLDAAVTSARLTHARLAQAPLHEEHYVFVGAPDHLAATPLATPEDARRHTLLDIDRDLPLFRYLAEALPPDERLSFAGACYLGTIGAIRMRVLAGAGVAVLPRYFVAGDLEAGRLVALLPEICPRTDFFRLIWREGHPHARVLTEISEALRRLPLR